jgi:hypothetical protein
MEHPSSQNMLLGCGSDFLARMLVVGSRNQEPVNKVETVFYHE